MTRLEQHKVIMHCDTCDRYDTEDTGGHVNFADRAFRTVVVVFS